VGLDHAVEVIVLSIGNFASDFYGQYASFDLLDMLKHRGLQE
jgi:hypothetical protein